MLKTISITESDTGEDVPLEVNFKQVWASLDDLSGSEDADGKIIALNVRKYVIRYIKEVVISGVEMLVVDEDGTYNITSVQQLGRKNFLLLKCRKRE
ncbi:head-tail adaptor protein [Lutibacter aestuarii]|uniref:Head-tail adaptor protein n=1 Tax=Lutibacter aestuarii TaxID=861111 RepID=A0ABW2ZCC0_9FLAO